MVLQCFRVHKVIKVSKHHFSGPEKGAYYAFVYVSYKHTHTYSVMHNTPLYTYKHMHIYAPPLEAAVLTVFLWSGYGPVLR